MQTVYLDISSRGVLPTIQAKQGDVGRKFLAVITDAGIPYDLNGSTLSVWYTGTSGKGNYSAIGENSAFSVNANKVSVELITQMLTNAGNGVLSLVLNGQDGKQIGLWNIPYFVEEVPGIGSDEATEYYTALSEAAGKAAAAIVRAEEILAGFVESEDHPGCYYRVVNGETEWINPPMVVGEEYRTEERYGGYPVYKKVDSNGNVLWRTEKENSWQILVLVSYISAATVE